ncbi:MAG: DMT family transporter [Pseudomonadota bacterium]|nr:DMT family transporter [Pseudomonadota bacterium]
MSTSVSNLSLVLLTVITMLAFAANSVLCRYALGSNLMDAASFSALRLIAGAIFLLSLVYFKDSAFKLAKPRTVPVLALLVYMLGFSFAYNQLSAATGALLLFGFVQITMLAFALRGGECPTLAGIAGYAVAVSGLLYLVAPGLESPPLSYAGLMAIAGVAWGIYSILGAGGRDPTQATAQNFFYASLIAIFVSFSQIQNLSITWQGALAAAVSGAVTSGLGYSIWYYLVGSIRAMTAALAQLSVPAIAAVGGALLLLEPLNQRIVLSTLLTLGGTAFVLVVTERKPH